MISARDQVSTRSLGYMHTCPVDIGIISQDQINVQSEQPPQSHTS